ncbi:MAG: FkbM family methyltransferase, partial [Ruminococcus sp.]|nr:FkbM family methyltransferase [Ruminococcus sp.]
MELDNIIQARSVWEYFRNCGLPVVLYGMGDGADKVLAAFERFGIEAAAVMASDGFVRGQTFHGYRVMTLAEVEARFGDFAVALCFASQLPEVMQAIKAVAARHKTLVPSVPVFGGVLFDD